jgi:hypothetical protein
MGLVKLCRHILLTVHSVQTVWLPEDQYVFVTQEMLSTRPESIIQLSVTKVSQ